MIVTFVDDVKVGLLRNILQEYLSYTIKIGELASRYTWASVMYYDDDDYMDDRQSLVFIGGLFSTSDLSTIALKKRDTRSTTYSNGNVTRAFVECLLFCPFNLLVMLLVIVSHVQ